MQLHVINMGFPAMSDYTHWVRVPLAQKPLNEGSNRIPSFLSVDSGFYTSQAGTKNLPNRL
jgi:hypothetical protein